MKTKITKINRKKPEEKIIRAAAKIIKNGGLVAFPTETVYGLGADALRAGAVKKIFEAKGRPADNPLIVHICDEKMLAAVVKEIPEKAFPLMKKFWPGPLTIIFKKKNSIPDIVTAGGNTVAVRMPAHPVALALIEKTRVPIAAPSANISTRPSPTEAKHVYEDLKGKIPLILDGGHTRIGVESTVVDLTTKIPTILRKGKITSGEIKDMIGPVLLSTEKKEGVVRSPGQKYRHYAPKAKLILVSGGSAAVKKNIRKYPKNRVCVITFTERKDLYMKAYKTFIFGKRNDPLRAARSFFSLLRKCDEKNADVIIVETPPKNGVGDALIDRISRAAS